MNDEAHLPGHVPGSNAKQSVWPGQVQRLVRLLAGAEGPNCAKHEHRSELELAHLLTMLLKNISCRKIDPQGSFWAVNQA